MRLARFTLLSLLLAALAGCTSLNAVQVDSDEPRIGNVYIVRGLIGIWSFGMDDLADKLQEQGVRAVVFQDAQSGSLARHIASTYSAAKNPEPLILVGHSLGADDVVTIARDLDEKKVRVDLLITLDPVSPSKVPTNVRRAVNYYKSNGVGIPIFRGAPLVAENPSLTHLKNEDLRTTRKDLDKDGDISHFNIDDRAPVLDEVVKQILTVTTRRSR